jgi:hypothetical protein
VHGACQEEDDRQQGLDDPAPDIQEVGHGYPSLNPVGSDSSDMSLSLLSRMCQRRIKRVLRGLRLRWSRGTPP